MKKLRGVKFLFEDATYDEMTSPVGRLTLITTSKGLHAVLWGNAHENPHYEKMINSLRQSKNEETLVKTKQQLTEYFQGKRKMF
ncbi:MAG: hypothetical protein ACD_46C00523G0001, partial [uncultured bacterium]